MKQHVIIKTNLDGHTHEVVDSSFVLMLSQIYSKVTLYAPSVHCDYIECILSEMGHNLINVEFYRLNTKYKGKKFLVKSIFSSLSDIICFFKSDHRTDIFYMSPLFLALLPIHIFSSFFRKKIYCVCHTELELIEKKKYVSISEKILGMNLQFFFKKIKICNSMKFILLGRNIQKEFRTAISPKNRNQILFLDHPYCRPNLMPSYSANIEHCSTFKIGLISSGNSDILSTILSLINRPQGEISFYIISKFCNHFLYYENLIFLNKEDELLNYSMYANYIDQMDVIIFFYPIGSYKYTASGALLEAIWHEKPIIAFRNDYFSYVFNKFGQMGILCDSTEQLVDAVCNYEKFLEKKNQYIENMKLAKAYLHPLKLVTDLDKLLDNVW